MSVNGIQGDSDFVDAHFYIKPFHLDYLKKINPDNVSNALRQVLDKYMKQQRSLHFEKYLTSLAIGLLLVAICSTIQNLWISISGMLVGLFMIGYSVTMYYFGRKQYEEKKRGDAGSIGFH